jgi:hypothetical protein
MTVLEATWGLIHNHSNPWDFLVISVGKATTFNTTTSMATCSDNLNHNLQHTDLDLVLLLPQGVFPAAMADLLPLSLPAARHQVQDHLADLVMAAADPEAADPEVVDQVVAKAVAQTTSVGWHHRLGPRIRESLYATTYGYSTGGNA